MEINNVIFNDSLYDIINELKKQLYANGIQMFAKITDSGEDLMVCCPYHKDGQERRPSAGIRKSDGMFHCLACGETHSLPEMISYCFGYNDPFGREGYKWLVKNFSSLEVQNRDDLDLDLDRTKIKSNYQSFCVSEEELDSYRYTHPYMYKRGLTDEIIELFDIGYDKKTDSITFPVRYWGSANFGKCLFVARRQVKTKRFDIPKGIEKPLYGLYEIWNMLTYDYFADSPVGVVGFDKIYVCEGVFDALRLWCNGMCAVAGFGCLFSDYQIRLLEELPTRHLILALDNDDAGRKATAILRKVLTNKLVYEAVLPDGRKDIGECTDEEIKNLKEVL